MAKQTSLLVVDAKMYRHFAIITVAITGAMALMADGEKREAIAQGIEEVQNYEPEESKEPQLIIKNNHVGSGGGDLGGFYSTGGNLDGGGMSSSYNPGALSLADTGFKVDPKRLAQLGYTLAQFNALSPAEREEIMVKLNNGATAIERKQGIENAGAASLSRSGGGKSADY